MRQLFLFLATIAIITLVACSNESKSRESENIPKQETEEKIMPKKSTANLNASLLRATKAKDLEQIRSLLDQGAQVDAVNSKGESGLLIATHENDIQMAQLFLKYDADVNLQDHMQDSPFLYAGAEGRTEILRHMLSHHPDYKLTNRFGGTALIPAAEKGHLANVRLLLAETEIDVNHVNNPGWTAILEAIVLSNGNKTQQQIVQALLENGADPNIADANGVTPLQHAKEQNYHAIADMLQAHGAK
ncbi:ankyrin repeat domain-containing protein [Listeria grandensis]|uniref:ankyrin repeat domain-containing protein n=1 Tax=Listeria grandensis TaxID=1494963 RepID=UPI00164E84FB|nr:ankyrin repeat domain-containing protein [Listeria grandensis]MBC6315007.1 ankyrin repeat domain-containing protein [Listeria grandensis]